MSMSHLFTSVNLFNALIPPTDTITLDEIFSSPCPLLVRLRITNFSFFLTIYPYLTEHVCYQFLLPMLRPGFQLFPHQVLLNLHMDPPEFQIALKWWLGMDLAQGLNCTFCPSLALDPLGHHAITCKHVGDVVSRHNKLRDVFVECCRRANVSA